VSIKHIVYIKHMEETPMTYAKNSLGRSTGRKFNMAAVKREMAKRSTSFDSEAFEKARKLRDAQPKTINFGGK